MSKISSIFILCTLSCTHTVICTFLLDRRLTWKDHVEYLLQSCTPAIDLLKHLSHLSQGADRKTFLRMYVAIPFQARLWLVLPQLSQSNHFKKNWTLYKIIA